MTTTFRRLNDNWNAEPNAPQPAVRAEGRDLVLTFRVNSFQFPAFGPDDIGVLRFPGCRRYRLGPTNDEGWYRGQCRFSRVAPAWGEFYEVTGDLRLDDCPQDWVNVSANDDGPRHFLFYFRDQTFECDAAGWDFRVEETRQNWLLPWGPLPQDRPNDGLADELRREVCQQHVLFDIPVRSIGVRQDCDDVLFELLDGSGRLAVVHLTFAQHPEPDARWPQTSLFADWSEFARTRMVEDHSG